MVLTKYPTLSNFASNARKGGGNAIPIGDRSFSRTRTADEENLFFELGFKADPVGVCRLLAFRTSSKVLNTRTKEESLEYPAENAMKPNLVLIVKLEGTEGGIPESKARENVNMTGLSEVLSPDPPRND